MPTGEPLLGSCDRVRYRPTVGAWKAHLEGKPFTLKVDREPAAASGRERRLAA